MTDTDWVVHPHRDLTQLAENLWWVEGKLPNMGLSRTMTVARDPDGGLVLHSAIALDEDGMAQLESLGSPRVLVVPNGWHRLDAPRYKARYPELQVICPARARARVEQKVPVDATYDGAPELGGIITFEQFDADRHMEGAMVVRSEDGVTLILGDSLFNLPHKPGIGWTLYGRVLGNTGGPRVTSISRTIMMFTRSKAPYKAFLARWAARDDVVRLVPGHGAVVTEDAAGVLERLAGSL